MSDIVPTTEVTKRDLARGRNLRIAGISAPILLTLIPLTVFLILTALFSGTPTVVISIIFFGIVATVVGLLFGLGISAYSFVKHQRWSTEMRERIAIGGIGANEIHWFRKELKPAEKRALKALKVADPLILDAYRETLVMRLVEGMTGPEIAERTGLKHESVRVNLHRGMKMLRQKLCIEE